MIWQVVIYSDTGKPKEVRKGPEDYMRKVFKKWAEDLSPGWSIALRTDRVEIMRYRK